MTTPFRPIPDFDMSSIRKDVPQPTSSSGQPPPSGLYNATNTSTASTAAGPPSSMSAGAREMEQRFARLVAEGEYKLLEERGKAHEREAKLREEIAREKQQIPKLVNERLEAVLAQKEREWKALYEGKGSSSSGPSNGASAEVEKLKQQLAETQRLLQDAERRYQQEKRELLNLRTAQLKNESSKRGQEGDIIGRAMQVMSEYETIVRSSEENSLARLAHHMENFEKEWIRRSREFEERKAEFEAQVMTKALDALQVHNQDVESVGRTMVEKTLDVLRAQGESRLQLEEESLHRAEQFKLQYKEMLEIQYVERCRIYDEKIADRERNLTKILEQERHRIIAVEQQAIGAHEQAQVEALTDAMHDISKLREQLVAEHHEQQAKAMADLVERRNVMRDEQNRLIQQANERVKDVERQCFEAVDSAQKALKEIQLHLINREADLTKQLMDSGVEKEHQRMREVTAAREETEAHWKAVVEELRAQHHSEVLRLTTDFQDRIDRERTEQFTREADLRKLYEQKLVKVEESADQRWANRVAEGNRALDRHLEVIQALRDDNEHLTAQLTNFQQQFILREQEMGQKVSQIQREHEAVWHRKMEEMRLRYDQLLDEALGGPQGESVSRSEHEKILEQVRELEERCVHIKQAESQRLQHERDHLNELWKKRLDDERAERAVWEEEQLKHLQELRVEIYADARRKETEILRRSEQERIRLHEEAMGRSVEERKDREAFDERLRMESEVRIREAEEELNEAYADKVRVLERRVEEKELIVEKRRLDLKREYAAMEEASKQQAAEWLEKEKKEILSDVKKFHEKLVEEQQRIEIERVTFEQRLAMQYAEEFEQAKAALQVHMTTMTRNHMNYWTQCEQEWLQHRSEEMRVLFEQRIEHAALLKDQTQRVVNQARDEARTILRTEREALDKRESEINASMEKYRIEMEAVSRERALKLLDDRNHIQEEAEAKRAKEEANVWEQLERRILEKERQAESDRRVLELELRNRYETLMNSERHRIDVLMDQHRTEARELYEKQLHAIRLRDEEWHRQRLQIESDERTNFEKQFQEVREQAEQRVQEERKRFELSMRVREQEFESERTRSLDILERQLRDHETATRTQMQSLKEDYDRRVREQIQKAQHNREEYLADLALQESRFQSQRIEYEESAAAKFEKSLKEIRSVMEKRAREQQVKDIEAREGLEKQRREFEDKLSKQYEDLLKNHELKLLHLYEEREATTRQLEKEHQEHLLAVRADMEKTVAQFFSQADQRSKEMTESTRQQFQARLEEYYQLIASERKKRVDAESALAAAQDEKEALRLSMEQHKLEVQRQIQQRYEKLFVEMREKSRQDKEDHAKKLLEEEEKKLANEILRRETEKKKDLAAVSQAVLTQGSSSSFLKGNTDFSFLAKEAATPMTRNSYAQQQFVLPPSSEDFTPTHSSSKATSQQQQQSVQLTSSTDPNDPFNETIRKRKEKLQQLWNVMDCPQDERNKFMESAVGLAPNVTLEVLTNETRRLEMQLPLLEVITRREFVQHRIKDLEKQPGKQKQTEDFLRELSKLTDHLKAEIPRHEQKSGQKFMFRGTRFMDVLLSEAEMEAKRAGGSYSLQH